MARRRLLSFALLLLLIALLASALAPRERSAERQPGPAAAPSAPPARVIRATVPPTREIRAALGDVVTLEVRGEDSDEVEIADLGVRAPIEPDVPATLTFTADQVGRFAITLRDAEVRLGTVTIDEPALTG